MRTVKYTDRNGYRRIALVRDSDLDEEAPERGIQQNPPDLHQLDWQEIIREIHNHLVDRGLVTWRDVQASGEGVSAILRTVLKRRIINLYKLQEK